MRVALIGYGKVGQAILSSFEIDYCLVRRRNCVQTNDRCNFVLDYSELSEVDMCVISVTDDAIEEVASKLKPVLSEECVVVHTSGSVSMSTLSGLFAEVGVLYPLYPFASGVEVDFSKITLLLEYSSPRVKRSMQQLLEPSGCNTIEADSQLRSKIHIAAIFASNFVNHLVSLSQELLQQQGLELDIVRPLLDRVFSNIQNSTSQISALQTGPAQREDNGIIDSHLGMLDGYNREIYELLTKSIVSQKTITKNGNKKL